MPLHSGLLKGLEHLQREGRDARQQKQRKAEEASAAAAAEELIAEEAREAAQAAAKKAKKKKAKARKQQARSDATPASSPAASEAAAGLSLQAQQDVGAMATLEQGSPSGTRGCEMPPDQDAAGLQVQLQHMTAPDCAMPTIHEPAAKEEQVLLSASTDVCESADSAVAHGNSPGGNATFLDQLFCCPITKVHAPSLPYLDPPSLCLPTLSPSFSGFVFEPFPGKPCQSTTSMLPCSDVCAMARNLCSLQDCQNSNAAGMCKYQDTLLIAFVQQSEVCV